MLTFCRDMLECCWVAAVTYDNWVVAYNPNILDGRNALEWVFERVILLHEFATFGLPILSHSGCYATVIYGWVDEFCLGGCPCRYLIRWWMDFDDMEEGYLIYFVNLLDPCSYDIDDDDELSVIIIVLSLCLNIYKIWYLYYLFLKDFKLQL